MELTPCEMKRRKGRGHKAGSASRSSSPGTVPGQQCDAEDAEDERQRRQNRADEPARVDTLFGHHRARSNTLGRASCWERVCQNALISAVAVSLKKKYQYK